MDNLKRLADNMHAALWPLAALRIDFPQDGAQFYFTLGEIENAKRAYEAYRLAAIESQQQAVKN